MHHYHPGLRVETITAGKFRRYHTLPVWQQIVHFRSIGWPNLVDIFKTIAGLVESLYKLFRWRPDVVFTKGGFVCLPVGIAARLMKIPLAIHESDAHSGLTNRILARWADVIGTGTPLENYSYPKEKAHYIGIPITTHVPASSEAKRRAYKKKLGIEMDKPLVVVTGGGLGAQRINDAVASSLPELVKFTTVFLVCGSGQYDELKEATKAIDSTHFILKPYVEGLVDVLAVADVVVSRAGATTLLELAALARPTVLVPNARLTGGHQLKNAAVYAKKKAVVLLDEDELLARPELLKEALQAILSDKKEQTRLSTAIHHFAKPYAAKEMAHLILSVAKK